jgi:diaminopimelate epimerase
MKMPKISRMSGAGNTFFLWNAIENPIPIESRTAVVRLLCSGYTGFRTDGFVFLDSSTQNECDFVWDFITRMVLRPRCVEMQLVAWRFTILKK